MRPLFLHILLLGQFTSIFSKPHKAYYKYPFQDPTLPAWKRTADLVGRLTLHEKAAQLGHFDPTNASLYIGRANSPAIARLGVERYNYGTECNAGIIVGYPQNIGMAATFNRSVVFHAGRGTGLGLRALWFNYDPSNPKSYPGLSCWSPMMNIMRHPLWGRNHEGYGEDPYLSGELTYHVVKGMQGDDDRYALVNAGCKHFAAFDGPKNGGDAQISEADWMQTYLPAFQKCFEAGSLSTMCTYARLNGVGGCQNPKVLKTWLREIIGFDGYVVSDQGAIHDAAASMNNGCDVEDGWGQYNQLENLTKAGDVQESTIDKALQRLFYVRIKHGEFDPSEMVPYKNKSKFGPDAYDHDFYSNISLSAAHQSITLLKNDQNFLPLDSTKQHNVAVFGIQMSSTAGYNTAPGTTASPSDALKAHGFNSTFISERDSSAVAPAARKADVAVIFIGRGGAEGEGGDPGDMSFPADQKKLVLDVISTNTPTVLILFNCDPVDLSFVINSNVVPAIIHAYYPQLWAGTAIADVLSGAISPAGRMPYSWPHNLEDAGDVGNYTMVGTSKTYRYWLPNKTAPLFPFGYGLSYTTFKYSILTVSPSAPKPCENVTVSVQVANTGNRDSDEVVQIYASWKNSPFSTPQRQLVGFERIHIATGKSALVKIHITPRQMAVLNTSVGSRFRPCDGNTTKYGCGTMLNTVFNTPITGEIRPWGPDLCCQGCQNATADVCVAWSYSSVGRRCQFHNDTSHFTTSSELHSTTSGVIFDRLLPFKPCKELLPVWSVIPVSISLSVGGQQPEQATSASSNVLSASFSITGPATPLSQCH